MGGGGKGSQTTQTSNQNQSYTANPAIQQSAYNALGMANSAASQPFQMPVAPVAGFSPLQQQAFNQYQSLQGQAQPYYDSAQSLYQQSAAPVSASDVSNYYNPMASNITAQMQNIFGAQNTQNTASLTNAAGGVGADRIAVGQADMANQQGLAAGQTYANLYQQALQAAQSQKQMQAGAASGLIGLGTASQNSALQGTSALFGAGTAQQQQNQSELNAPYQNTLAKLAYPFQSAQYLAGITGSLAPSLGGNTYGSGTQVSTPPQPSWLNQLLGIGTAGAGLYGSLGGFGGSESYGGGSAMAGDAYGGSSANPLPGLSPSDYGAGFADGGEVSDEPEINKQSYVPTINLQPGAGHSGPLTGGLQQPQQQQQQGSGSSGGGIGDALKMAAQFLPMLLKKGGKVPTYDDGGDIPYGWNGWGSGPFPGPTPSAGKFSPSDIGSVFPHTSTPDTTQYSPEETGDSPLVDALSRNLEKFNSAKPPAQNPYAPPATWKNTPAPAIAAPPSEPAAPSPEAPPIGMPESGPPAGEGPSLGGMFDGLLNRQAKAAPAPPAPPPAPQGGPMTKQPGVPYPGITGQTGLPPALTAAPPPPVARRAGMARPSGGHGGGGGGGGGGAPAAPASGQLPYPDALERDWGQKAARSPWMALIQAGATMASTPGPLGSAIGKGLLAGTKSVEDQRKELRSEQQLNDKAKELYEKAREHLDKYNKMTPYERASIAARNRELDQSEATPTGKPGKFTGADYDRAAKFVQSLNPGLPPEQLQPLIDAEVSRRRRSLGAAAPEGAGPSPATIANAKAAVSGGAKLEDVIAKARQHGIALTPDMLQ